MSRDDYSRMSPLSSDEENIAQKIFAPEVEGEESFVDDDADPVPVVIYSLGADNCFLPALTNRRAHRSMMQYNQSFFSALLTRLRAEREHTIFLVGGARQCWLSDLLNMCQIKQSGDFSATESYFVALKKCVEEINVTLPSEKRVTLDPFLLHDESETFKQLIDQCGSEWSHFIQTVLNEEKKLDVTVDPGALEDKMTVIKKIVCREWIAQQTPPSSAHALFVENAGQFALLYTQMHHIASQFSAEIPHHFHFYNDRLDILWPLIAVFIHSPDLIPKNMTLYFHHYVQGHEQFNPKDNRPVQGSGVIDLHYRETLFDMVAEWKIEKMKIGGMEIPVHVGNPLTDFFRIESTGDFNPHQFFAPVTTVFAQDAFHRFNEKRLERLAPTPSLLSPRTLFRTPGVSQGEGCFYIVPPANAGGSEQRTRSFS